MSTPAPENRKCPFCSVDLKFLAEETRTARVLCNAATDELFFEDHGLECLAMMLFAERKLQPPVSAWQLRDRMRELREPLA